MPRNVINYTAIQDMRGNLASLMRKTTPPEVFLVDLASA